MNDSALHLCDASADIAFGPAVEGCRDNFDFTIAFEQYFFSIAPSACFLLVAPLRLYYLCSKQPRVDGKGLRSLKLVRRLIFSRQYTADSKSQGYNRRIRLFATSFRDFMGHTKPL
jgi:hypothetical protein